MFGTWPIARNRPSSFRSRSDLSLVERSLTPVSTWWPLFLAADHFLDNRIPGVRDLGILGDAILHDLGSTKRIATVDQGDLGGEFREERGLFDGGIAPADDADLFSSIEVAVAGGARADAVAAERAFSAEPSSRGPGGHDHGRARVVADRAARRVAAGVVGGSHPERALREIHLEDGFPLGVGPEPLGLLSHQVHQIGAHDPVGEAGKIVDRRRQRQLSPGFLAFEYHRRQIGPRRVKRGRQARRTRTDHDHCMMSRWHRILANDNETLCPRVAIVPFYRGESSGHRRRLARFSWSRQEIGLSSQDVI